MSPGKAEGTEELERGLRPSRAAAFPPIAAAAVAMLLVFNSAGAVSWARQLPASQASAWLLRRAIEWNRLMVLLGPARVLGREPS